MSKLIHVKIVSAEKALFEGHAKLVHASALQGEMGIKPGHAQLITELEPGDIHLVQEDGSEQVFYVSGGLLEVQPHQVIILSDMAERADDIDEAKALEAQQRAQKAMQERQSDFDYAKVESELAQAAAMLRALKRMRKVKK